MTARAIIEAETPKNFLRQAPPPTIDRPMPFGSVPVGAWFRVGRFVFKRLDPERPGETGDWPDEEAQVMEAPDQVVVGEIWTFNHRSPVYPTTTDPKLASQSAKVSEAEDPKGVFRQAVENNVPAALESNRWKRHGSGWTKKEYSYRFNPDKTGAYPERQYYVWFDEETSEWVCKMEGEKLRFGVYCGQHDLGHWAFGTGSELLRWLKGSQIL